MKWNIFDKYSIISFTYHTVSSVIKLQIKKTADAPVDAGTFHLNPQKTKAVQKHEKYTSSSENSDTKCETTDNEYTLYDTRTQRLETRTQK